MVYPFFCLFLDHQIQKKMMPRERQKEDEKRHDVKRWKIIDPCP